MYKKVNVVMLPTNEKASSTILLGVLPSVATLTKDVLDDTHDWMKFGKPQHLYITSNEEIKEVFKGYAIAVLKEDNRIKELIEVITVQEDGCNRYTSIEYQQFSFKYHSIYPIIATTDTSLKINKFNSGVFKELKYSLPQLSQQFIEDYIKEYNKGNVITEVEVEYNNDWNAQLKEAYPDYKDLYKPKLVINSDNTINIKPIKDSWSREEVIELFHKYKIDHDGDGSYYKDILNKWLEENL